MSEQDQVPQGSIPPKVSPFSRTEGITPMPPPPAPGAPRPITVRLKSITPPAGSQPAAQEVEQVTATPLSANPRVTARVPIPNIGETDNVTAATMAVPPPSAPATVRLRPVSQQGAAPTPSAPVMPVMTPMSPPTPGSHPLPDGPKAPSGAQVQASKSKTSRISLDSAIGVAPMTPMSGDKSEPKTIRLKRPADLAAPSPKVSTAPIRQTSRIPDSVLPTVEAAAAEAATVTQKKTLKIRRPGAAEAAAAEGEAFPEGVQMTPIEAMEPLPQESKVFTVIAVTAAAACVIASLLLTVCLGAHAVGPVANKNTTASISGPELPWPGRLSE